MNKFISVLLMVVILLPSTIVLAKGSSYHARAKASKYHVRTKGNTHHVRTYVKKNGTLVQGHRAGNPGSRVHCKNNVCR